MQEKEEVFWDRAGSAVFLEDAAASRVSEPFPYSEQDVQSHQRWQTGQNSIRCDLSVSSKAAPVQKPILRDLRPPRVAVTAAE